MDKTLVLVAHAPLASAMREAALHAYPDACGWVFAVDVLAVHTPQEAHAAVGEVLASQGGQVLVLADCLGATPCNAAIEAAHERGARLVAGMNLPMVLRAINYRDKEVSDWARLAAEGGTVGVVSVSRSPPARQRDWGNLSSQGQDAQQ